MRAFERDRVLLALQTTGVKARATQRIDRSLRMGDVDFGVRVDGREIYSPEDAAALLAELPIGKEVSA